MLIFWYNGWKEHEAHNSKSFGEVLGSGLMINYVNPSGWEILLQKLLKTLEQINIQDKWQTVMKSIELCPVYYDHIQPYYFLAEIWTFIKFKVNFHQRKGCYYNSQFLNPKIHTI